VCEFTQCIHEDAIFKNPCKLEIHISIISFSPQCLVHGVQPHVMSQLPSMGKMIK